jgi:hypothetical protein
MPHITESQFTNRFCSLVLGKSDLPKKQDDLNILLYSTILKLDPERRYSEKEINEQLQLWTMRFGASFGLDHVTLRRFLSDGQYIQRDAAGTTYQLGKTNLTYTFDSSIKELDLDELIEKARREREERKRLYMKAAKP